MTDQEMEELTGWLRERMPGYQLRRESRDGMQVFEVRQEEGDEEGAPALLVLPGRFANGDEWPSLAELERALETASVDSLLMKGRRLRVRGDEQGDMRKVWVEDMESRGS